MNAPGLLTTPATDLHQRGIHESAMSLGWKLHPSGNGYIVPIWMPDGTRSIWTATYNTAQDAREKWGKVNLSGKPKNVVYYIAPGTLNAIQAAKGIVYLASGLTDALSYHAAGIKNVMAWFGPETAIPASLPADLKSWGVVTLVYLPDNDKTGKRAAQKLAGVLDGGGTTLDCRQIPGTAKDINDIWAGLAQLGIATASAAFHAILSSASQLPITPATKPANHHKQNNSDRDHRSTHTAIIESLGTSWLPTGKKSKPLICPFHEDQQPSAVLFSNNSTTGLLTLHCSVCGEFTQQQLAEHFNISPPGIEGLKASYLTNVGMTAQSTTVIALSKKLRSKLVDTKHAKPGSKLARFLDVLLHCKIPLGETYTAKELAKQIPDTLIPYGSIRNYLGEFCTSFDTLFSFVTDYCESFVQNPEKGGRPAKAYRIPTLAEVARFVGLAEPGSPHPLPIEALSNASTYAKAARIDEHWHDIAANQDWRHSQNYHPAAQKLAEGLGIGKRTLYQYEKDLKKAGKLQVTQRIKTVRVPDDYILTKYDEKQGFMYLSYDSDGNRVKVKPLSSKRRALIPSKDHDSTPKVEHTSESTTENPEIEQKHLQDPLEQFAVAELGAVICELPAPRYCRHCGQQPMFPNDPPRRCDFCGVEGSGLWQDTPPSIAPERLRENGRPKQRKEVKTKILP